MSSKALEFRQFCASGEVTSGFPSRVPPRVLFSLFLLLFTLQSKAAGRIALTFVDSATVMDTVIRLGDIAHITGTSEETRRLLAAVPIGQSAPAGFARYVNGAEAVRYTVAPRHPQLLIGHPPMARTRVVTLCHTGRLGDYEDLIMGYLRDAITWNATDYTVEIENLTEQFRCYDRPFEVRVEGLEGGRPRGNVQVALVIAQNGREQRIPVRCKIAVTTAVVVASRTIPRGSPLDPTGIELRRMDITGFRYQPATDVATVTGRLATRTLTAGTIIHDLCMQEMPLVHRNDLVSVITRKGSIRISVQARARESGGLGDRIWVQNVESRKLIRVEVCGRGEVRIDNGEAI